MPIFATSSMSTRPPRRRRPDWSRGVPRLQNASVTLREIRISDARPLLPHIADERVLQYVSPSPRSVDGMVRFARWAQAQRRRGALICFGVIPAGEVKPVGLIQVWPIDPGGVSGEWGVIIGHAYWGTGLFQAAADLLFQYAFTALQIRRLEARTRYGNGRANAAMRKIGAVAEGRLRQAASDGTIGHAVLWSVTPVTDTPRKPGAVTIAGRNGIVRQRSSVSLSRS